MSDTSPSSESILTGEDLLWAQILGLDDRARDALQAALARHIETGESLDSILALGGNQTQGQHSARRTLLRARRDEILDEMGDDLIRNGYTLWQASQVIGRAIREEHYSTDDYRHLSELLGDGLTSDKAIYNRLQLTGPPTPSVTD